MQTDDEIGKVAAAVPVLICILISNSCFLTLKVFCAKLIFALTIVHIFVYKIITFRNQTQV